MGQHFHKYNLVRILGSKIPSFFRVNFGKILKIPKKKKLPKILDPGGNIPFPNYAPPHRVGPTPS